MTRRPGALRESNPGLGIPTPTVGLRSAPFRPRALSFGLVAGLAFGFAGCVGLPVSRQTDLSPAGAPMTRFFDGDAEEILRASTAALRRIGFPVADHQAVGGRVMAEAIVLQNTWRGAPLANWVLCGIGTAAASNQARTSDLANTIPVELRIGFAVEPRAESMAASIVYSAQGRRGRGEPLTSSQMACTLTSTFARELFAMVASELAAIDRSEPANAYAYAAPEAAHAPLESPPALEGPLSVSGPIAIPASVTETPFALQPDPGPLSPQLDPTRVESILLGDPVGENEGAVYRFSVHPEETDSHQADPLAADSMGSAIVAPDPSDAVDPEIPPADPPTGESSENEQRPTPRGPRPITLHTSVSSVFDTNFYRNEDELVAQGVVTAVGVRYQSSPSRPGLQLYYEAARHLYRPAEDWNRISQMSQATLAHRLSPSVSLELLAEATLKGTSEDRDMGNLYALAPRLEYRIGRDHRLRFTGLYRLRELTDENATREYARYAQIDYRQRMDSRRWELRYRYEQNKSPLARRRYSRWTFGANHQADLSARNQFGVEIRYRAQTYPERLLEIKDRSVPRQDHRWIGGIAWTHSIPGFFSATIDYSFETRSSNDPGRQYDAHTASLTIQRAW